MEVPRPEDDQLPKAEQLSQTVPNAENEIANGLFHDAYRRLALYIRDLNDRHEVDRRAEELLEVCKVFLDEHKGDPMELYSRIQGSERVHAVSASVRGALGAIGTRLASMDYAQLAKKPMQITHSAHLLRSYQQRGLAFLAAARDKKKPKDPENL